MSKSTQEAGAQDGHEILRRLSMSSGAQSRQSLSDTDPVAANPSLGLSGGVISATFCIPYSVEYRKGADRAWVRFAQCLLARSNFYSQYCVDCLLPSHASYELQRWPTSTDII